LCLDALALILVPSSDVAELHQPGLVAQPQDLHEQRGERRQVALPEVADGAEVGPLHAGHRHHIETLLARPGDPARGVEPLGEGVEQQRDHHRRMVGRLAARLVVVRQDRRQVQLVAHQLAHQMRRMAGRHEVVDRRRQQPHLVHVPRSKGLAHAR